MTNVTTKFVAAALAATVTSGAAEAQDYRRQRPYFAAPMTEQYRQQPPAQNFNRPYFNPNQYQPPVQPYRRHDFGGLGSGGKAAIGAAIGLGVLGAIIGGAARSQQPQTFDDCDQYPDARDCPPAPGNY